MKKLFTLLSFFLFCGCIYAQPANDNCADAIVVVAGDIVDFNNIDATIDGPFHPSCVSNTNDTIFADIWYSFTPSFSGFADWSMCATADFDTKIAVYNGNATCPFSDADLLICNDDFGSCSGSTSRAVFEVTSGETYLLRLGGWGETAPGNQGTGTFTIGEFFSTVANDFCQFAEPIDLGEDFMFESIGATTDGPDHPGNGACFGFGDITVQNDIWYTFTSPITGTVEWSTCDQISFDSRMAIYNPGSACPPVDGDLYACNDDGSGCSNFTSRVIFDVEQGETYLLRLGGFGGETGSGTFDLVEIIPPEPPANDLCMNADSAWISTEEQADEFDFPIEGTTLNATFDPGSFPTPNAQCAGFDLMSGEFNSVWYEFNSFDNEELEVRFYKGSEFTDAAFYFELFENCENHVDTMAIFGSCLNVAEEDDFGITLMGGITPNTDYLIRIYTRVTTDLPGDFFFFLVGMPPSSAVEAFPGTFEVYPNPTNDRLNLGMYVTESARTNLTILNTLGQIIEQKDVGQLATGQHTFQFDTGGLTPGMYFLSVQSDKGTSLVKFSKE